jgi:short subunit dehydrogenase-like uncharacterized protein
MLQVQADPALRALVFDPYALVPGWHRQATQAGGGQPAVTQDPRTNRWEAPSVLGQFNRQVVLRSNAVAGWAYGTRFRYREVVDTGTGPRGAAKAAAVWAGTGALMGAMAFAPTRSLLDRVLPDPGEGPDAAQRRNGHFRVDVEAETTTGARYRTIIAAERDPGYDGTAVMFGESALCLAEDMGLAEGVGLPVRAGVLTPMTAMGEALAVRLRSRGFTVSTERIPGS